jgi:hypothetical protein
MRYEQSIGYGTASGSQPCCVWLRTALARVSDHHEIIETTDFIVEVHDLPAHRIRAASKQDAPLHGLLGVDANQRPGVPDG